MAKFNKVYIQTVTEIIHLYFNFPTEKHAIIFLFKNIYSFPYTAFITVLSNVSSDI